MKKMMMILGMLMVAQLTFAQAPGELTGVEKANNGGVIATGIDPFGAEVMVVYSADLVKVYQERTINDQTTFARFDNGKVVDYGVLSKPVANEDDLPLYSLDSVEP